MSSGKTKNTVAATNGRTTRKPKAPSQAELGVIRRDELLSLKAFLRRLGWGKWIYRRARRKGLPVHSFGGRSYVYGDQFVEWLLAQGGATDDAAAVSGPAGAKDGP